MSTTHRRWIAGAAIVATAFALRLVFASLSVTLPEVAAGTGLPAVGTSVLTTLPVLCLGLFAPLAPPLAERFGTERTLLGAMLILAACTVLRAFGPVYLLFGGSALSGCVIAIGNVLLPGLVKRDFPDRIGLLTGLYVMAISGGAALAAGATVPIERAAGAGWRFALAIWALPVLPAIALWISQLRVTARSRKRTGPLGALWGSLLAWKVTLFMGLQSALAFSVFGWLAVILRARGVEATTAGLVLSVLILTQLATCLTVPAIAVRQRDQRVMAAALTVAGAGGLMGLLYAPLAQVWLWALVQGAGQGGLIALALTLIVLRAEDPSVAARLSGMAQAVGYIIAALAPLTIGLLRALTGGFDATGWLVALIGAGLLWSGLGAGRARFVVCRGIITSPNP
ncbi:CynX/NimT family MFS transporter [Sphingomonas sp. BAUL-RG-20F-R05-02]|uniref:CynX/NimT family MFS transporter n=1 Tax=Sphingomonas sp. BAUL-RG-20F-R05-02 TaxID=2914830 RepID=UPI001F59C9CB|nr:MFS transporter [Sphingomonas sp. BAUL-RG-20F-R05-02]